MKRVVCILFIISSTFKIGRAQGFADFKYLGDRYGGETYLGVTVSNIIMSNNDAPFPEVHRKQATVIDVEFNRIDFSKGGRNYRGDYKLVSDLIFITSEMVKRKSNGDRDESSAVGCGLLGWHSWSWNIIAKPRFCFATGLALNDYFLGASYRDTLKGRNDLVSPEPQGWYLTAGPSIMAHVMLNKWLVLRTTGSYAFSFNRALSLTYATVNSEYPKPHFINATASILTPWGIFVETQYTGLVNRGNIPNATKRLEFKLGFNFVL